MANDSIPAAGPLFVSSGDLVADRRYKWALDQAARGDFAGAADILVQTVELAPAFAAAWFALGAMRDRLGDRDSAVAAFARARDADPEDYHGARLQLARLGAGEVTPAVTAVYVRRLFDQHAPRFDAAAHERLGYRGPALLYDAVARAWCATGQEPRFGTMLDLGCGTGLAGAVFRPCVDQLVGVDISAGMIAQARSKGVYDRLITGELLAFLHAAAAAADSYNVVLAADVFVYVHDLSPVAAAASRVLTPGGLFAFTVETHDGGGVVLQHTLRYAHSAGHIRAALAGAGLTQLTLEPASTRTENGEPVAGLLVVARRD